MQYRAAPHRVRNTAKQRRIALAQQLDFDFLPRFVTLDFGDVAAHQRGAALRLRNLTPVIDPARKAIPFGSIPARSLAPAL